MKQEKTKQIVFIINGRGHVGKDTMINFAKEFFRIRNVSSIDPIKKIARVGGWKDSDKATNQGRQLLVDLKKLFVTYNDLPQQFLLKHYKKFVKTGEDFMFVHIREPEEIQKFKQATGAKTLLLTRKTETEWDIENERNVADYKYDYVFANDGAVQESGERFVKMLEDIRREN